MKACCIIVSLLALTVVGTVNAKTVSQKGVVGADGEEATVSGKDAKVVIAQMPKPGRDCLVRSPMFQYQANGGAALMPALSRKPRYWGVFELKYQTAAKWQDELTFSWYVLAKANPRDARNDETVTPFSFYSTSVRYVNIPRGDHMACVCLDPSLIERYGEPIAISVVISNKNGDELALQTADGLGLPTKPSPKWWDNPNVMQNNKPEWKVERRTGLVDRSKTPFALINSSDYEVTQ